MMRSVSQVTMMLVVVATIVVTMSNVLVSGQTSPSECKEERKQLEGNCKPVIFGRQPSPECCARVRVMHVECVCPYVTPKLAALIGIDRTIKQIEGCGRTVPRNFKCYHSSLSEDRSPASSCVLS
ncbi:hypothetical protein NL676_000083 [Syzygium grande]|nr:hypothetical protein NL676_000083 [Syzygium grande]